MNHRVESTWVGLQANTAKTELKDSEHCTKIQSKDGKYQLVYKQIQLKVCQKY